MDNIKEFRLSGYIDYPVEDLSGFNVYISIYATNKDEAWEKLFAMSSEQFKKEADAHFEDVGGGAKKVWEEVKDANDGIDWYFEDVDLDEYYEHNERLRELERGQ